MRITERVVEAPATAIPAIAKLLCVTYIPDEKTSVIRGRILYQIKSRKLDSADVLVRDHPVVQTAKTPGEKGVQSSCFGMWFSGTSPYCMERCGFAVQCVATLPQVLTATIKQARTGAPAVEAPVEKKKSKVDEKDIKKKKKPVEDDADDEPKKKKKPVEDDDDGDDEPKSKKKSKDDDEDEEDDEPKSKKKSKDDDEDDSGDDDEDEPKAKKKSKDEDEDEEDDEPKSKKKSKDDDEDEDDRPKKKSKDGDEDDSGDDDDEDEPKAKKKSKDDDEDEEDDEPKSKKKSKDDDEDDSGDDEDEGSKKKSSKDDDEGDDDEEEKEKELPEHFLKAEDSYIKVLVDKNPLEKDDAAYKFVKRLIALAEENDGKITQQQFYAEADKLYNMPTKAEKLITTLKSMIENLKSSEVIKTCTPQ